ncbi:protein disulfide isomerase [Trypanosoma grayi]|uniref:protein disulfide isomerase n=1 Tax=Trypanosoma grayi TaxID=71804 RepID=UPI0004F44645|nr:protein disulfide isomerase [Trypanosoma grayi]KEG08581.1 protein disulfide isomerase [Trypanosoma grayi]
MGVRSRDRRSLVIGLVLSVGLLLLFVLYSYLSPNDDVHIDVPVDGPGAMIEDVTELASGNYRSVVGKSKFALVEFYATWCGYCKEFAPVYAELAAAVRADAMLRERVVLAKIDSRRVRQLAPHFQVKGYPSLFLVPPFEAKGQEYKGQRSVKAILAFLRAHVH